MNQVSNMSMSISLVRKELETTLQKAEGYFAQYAEDNEPSQLKLFADELNLARGTFKLLELTGAELLCTEMQSLAGDGSISLSLKLDALGQSLINLRHYVSVILKQEREYPVLLIPAINRLRKTVGHKPITESHFFAVNLRPRLPKTEKSSIDIRPHLARIRLMYQTGLLRVIRGQSPIVGYKLIGRSLNVLEKGFRGTIAWPFWWCASAAVTAMIEDKYELTSDRAALFARVDQTMRAMIKEGLSIFTSANVNETHKDLLFLVSLSEQSSGLIADIKKTYNLQQDLSEPELQQQRRMLSGPDIGAFDSLSKAIKAQIDYIKTGLDKCALGALPKEEFVVIEQQIMDLSRVLKAIEQPGLSDYLEKQGKHLKQVLNASKADRMGILAAVADALLQIELASGDFSKGINKASAQHIIGAGHYAEARIVLFDEIQSALTMAKRAIAAFVDDGDKLHLANIKPSLDGARGAFLFLQEPTAASVISAAGRFLSEKVLGDDPQVNESKLEVLADTLTSVEYYAETLSHSDNNTRDILALAVKGMAQLGYKVA